MHGIKLKIRDNFNQFPSNGGRAIRSRSMNDAFMTDLKGNLEIVFPTDQENEIPGAYSPYPRGVWHSEICNSFELKNVEKLETFVDDNGETWIRAWRGNVSLDFIPRSNWHPTKKELDDLREKVQAQRRDLTTKREALEDKNRQLNALHRVWCTGCTPGKHIQDLDDETLDTMMVHLQRLREWFLNYSWRKLEAAQKAGNQREIDFWDYRYRYIKNYFEYRHTFKSSIKEWWRWNETVRKVRNVFERIFQKIFK